MNQRKRVRFSIVTLMVLVALVGLNLAALKSSLSYYPRPVNHGSPSGMPSIEYGAMKTYINGPDGSYVIYNGRLEYEDYLEGKIPDPKKLRVIRPPRPPAPTLFQIWLPVLASVAATLVVLALAVLLRRASASTKALKLRYVIIALTIALALAGLNIAAFKSSFSNYPRRYPRPVGSGAQLGQDHKGHLFIDYADGSEAVFNGTRQEYKEFLASKNSDPGRLKITRPPAPTLFQIWMPVMFSVTGSLVVFVAAMFRSRASDPQSAEAVRGADELQERRGLPGTPNQVE